MSGYEVYLAHQAVQQHVSGLVIRYRITLDGPEVEFTHSDVDESLPEFTVRVRTGGHELLLGWLLSHIDMHDAKLRTHAPRFAPEWLQAWQRAHPDG